MEVVDVPDRSLWRLTYLIEVFMEVVDVPDRGLYGGCRRT